MGLAEAKNHIIEREGLYGDSKLEIFELIDDQGKVLVFKVNDNESVFFESEENIRNIYEALSKYLGKLEED